MNQPNNNDILGRGFMGGHGERDDNDDSNGGVCGSDIFMGGCGERDDNDDSGSKAVTVATQPVSTVRFNTNPTSMHGGGTTVAAAAAAAAITVTT
jgi:hypothetical protein